MAGRSTARMGIAKEIIGLLKENPKDLWTWDDLLEAIPDSNEKAVQNSVHRLFTEGQIKRHMDRCEDTNRWRYGMSIPESKADKWVKNENVVAGATRRKGKKKKKGQMPSAREIRMMFAQTQNQMAKMEDMMVAVVEEAEELEKMMNKIRNISNL